MAITIKNDGVYPQAVKGDATGNVALSLGATASEGLTYEILEEVVDLTAAGAKFVAMTTAVPANSVILSVSANIEELAVSATTSVKVGVGLNATDPDKYGITSTLVKNQKINTLLADVVLSSAEQLDVCACVTAGTIGGSNFTAGKVRVRVVYKTLSALANA